MSNPSLVYNAIRTPDGTLLESFTRYDFKEHTDANGNTYAVDGGLGYARRIGPDDSTELSVWSDEPHEKKRLFTHWGTYGKNGDEPFRYIPVVSMTTEHIEAVLKTQIVYPPIKQVLEDELKFRSS